MRRIEKPLLKRYDLMVILALVLGIIIIYLPENTIQIDGGETLFSAVTFLFGIIGGFTIALVWDEFTETRDMISEDDALYKTIWGLITLFDKKSVDVLRKNMDKILVLGYSLGWSEFSRTDGLLTDTFNKIEKLMPKTSQQKDIYDQLLNLTSDWEKVRSRLYVIGESRISKIQMGVLLVLGLLMILTRFGIRQDHLAFDIIIYFVSLSVFLVLFLIHDLDNYSFSNALWGEKDAESYERLFDIIEMPYYYPEELVNLKMVRPKGKDYRTKIPKDYLKDIK